MAKSLFVILTLLLFTTLSFSQEGGSTIGLYFSSGEAVQDRRTSLDLTPFSPVKVDGGINLKFDALFRQGDGHYGYIFRIITNTSSNIDLIANLASETHTFSLVYKDKILLTFDKSEFNNFRFDNWYHFNFLYDIKQKKATLSISELSKSVVIEYEENISYNIIFGLSDIESFQSTDVCPMSLKNVEIFDTQGNLIHFWPLAKHGFSRTYDELSNTIAEVNNPKWLIDSHLYWEKTANLKLNKYYGVVSDGNHTLYFVDDKWIIEYNLLNNATDTIRYLSGGPYRELNEKHVIYNPYTKEIWSYSLDYLNISKFNFSTRRWSADPPVMEEANFGHHNKLFSPVDSTLVAFFGYGQYQYNSTIFNYKPKSDIWLKYDRINQIEPRYLASTGLLNSDTLLVYGGYGSKTGRQEEMPRSYNDLFFLNLKTFEFKKILEYPTLKSTHVPIETLIIDDDSTGYYTLVYDRTKFNTHLQLIRNGIYESTQTFYPDSIEFNFLDTESWAYLFLNRENQKMYAVTSNKSDINIYSMSYPPLTTQSVYQVEEIEDSSGKSTRILLLILSLVILTSFIVVVYRKRKVKDPNPESLLSEYNSILLSDDDSAPKSSIMLNGEFKLYSDKGKDLSVDFSPTLKQLFLIIFFHSVTLNKGISSKKIDETLWFDKNEKSARNNRNVNISKLRSILEGMIDLELICDNSFWKLNISPHVYCDYLHVMNIISNADQDLNEADIQKFLGLLNNGNFLSDVQADWVDSYRSQYFNSVIDFLIKLFSLDKFKKNNKLLIEIADCLLSFDSLNDEAMAVKCRALYKEGKGKLSFEVYRSFCKEYTLLLNEEYPVSFDDIIKKKDRV